MSKAKWTFIFPKKGEKTERQWNLAGYIVKPDEEGITRYTNIFWATAVYYNENQVEKSDSVIRQIKDNRNAKAREERRMRRVIDQLSSKADDCLSEVNNHLTKTWDSYKNKSKRILVFDTETNSLSCLHGSILSLSWQLLDGELNVIDKRNLYFMNPATDAACIDAINVNGLTHERLSELNAIAIDDLTDRKKVIEDFVNVVRDSDLIVSYCYDFHNNFVSAAAERLKLQGLSKRKPYLDIQEDYATLQQIAKRNKVDVQDIKWHRSSDDVEVIVRVLRAMRKADKEELIPQTIDARFVNEYQKMYKDFEDAVGDYEYFHKYSRKRPDSI